MSGQRQRRPGRGRAAVAVAAAAVAVGLAIGAPVLLGAGGGSGTVGGEGRATRAGTAWVPDGWRAESWGDLTWAVPGDWGYGAIDQWCVEDGADAAAPRPVVQRPYGASTLVGCRPPRGLGLQVTVDGPLPPTGPDAYVEGAAVAQKRFGDVALTISTHSRTLTERVLGTAHMFEGQDPHGCPSAAEPVDLGDGEEAREAKAGRLSVCRYALGRGDNGSGGVLDQSELLSAVESARAWAALRRAPAGTGPDADPADCRGWHAEAVVLLRTSAAEVAWVHHDGCSGHGVELLGDGSRRLTEEVLRWALSPGWSGGVDGSVPMPDRLRTQRR